MNEISVRRAMPRWCAVLCVLMLLAWPASAQQGPLPPLVILCALAGEKAWTPAPASAVSPPDTSASKPEPALPAGCDGAGAGVRGTLSGSGDVLVVVTEASWAQALKQQPNGAPPRPRLFINGIQAGDDTALLGPELMPNGTVYLRYHVAASKATRALWTALYRVHDNMRETTVLRASLGWDTLATSIASPAGASAGPLVRVTTGLREAMGFSVIVLLAAFFVWCLRKTDVFRDLRARPAEQVPDLPVRLPAGTLVRSTYSLARVQWGVWLWVVLSTEVFMWIVLADLPPLPPMLVALISVSVVTSLASYAVDSGAGVRPFLPSRHLLHDIVTGWDGAQQLHRTQAVAVNLVLLVAVVESVVRNLAFPDIDSSLLALLGVSGVAQTGGKQVLETAAKTDAATAAAVAKTQAPRVPSGRSV